MISQCQVARGTAYGIIASMVARKFSPDEIREELNKSEVWYDLSDKHRKEIHNVLDRIERDYCSDQEKGEESENLLS